MRKALIGALTLLATFNVFAVTAPIENTRIVCGDVNAAYTRADLPDLSKNFSSEYLTSNDRDRYELEGYNYILAGRNCGLANNDNSPRFEILYLFKSKNIVTEAIDLGSMSVYGADLKITGLNILDLTNDLILEGSSKKHLEDNNDSSISAELKLSRGIGKVKLIIRRANRGE